MRARSHLWQPMMASSSWKSTITPILSPLWRQKDQLPSALLLVGWAGSCMVVVSILVVCWAVAMSWIMLSSLWVMATMTRRTRIIGLCATVGVLGARRVTSG